MEGRASRSRRKGSELMDHLRRGGVGERHFDALDPVHRDEVVAEFVRRWDELWSAGRLQPPCHEYTPHSWGSPRHPTQLADARPVL